MSFIDLCENLREELELEYSNRLSELVEYENFLVIHSQNETFDENYRKMLVIMLYSYFEGFCKQALLIYVDYLNRTEELVSKIKYGLAAITIERNFLNLANPSYKPVSLGERAIKEDGILQLYGRRREFISEYVDITRKTLSIPDSIVDTECNLKSHVLKKLLFKLEIDFTIVDEFQKDINEVVNKRNALAHGERARGIGLLEYNNYREKVFNLMKLLKTTIHDNYCQKKYLKNDRSDIVS